MAHTKSLFSIGDKVEFIKEPGSEGVVVFDSNTPNDTQYSVHWHNFAGRGNTNRGLYSANDLKKYF